MKDAAQWMAGPPPGRGRYWVVWNLRTGTRVEAVEVSPALIDYDNPHAELLIKMLGGAAFKFEANRGLITHHMPIVAPEMPR